MMRVNLEDTTLSAPNLTPTRTTAFFPKHTHFALDMISTSRNARHYPEPHAFRPQRWTESSSGDGFLAFSVGPRLCLGKRFSTVEAVAFLSNALRDWKFDIRLDKGETMEEWTRRIMCPTIGVTLKLGESI